MQINRRTLMWGIIAILFIITLFVSFKTGAGSAVASAGQAISESQSSPASAMVGGC